MRFFSILAGIMLVAVASFAQTANPSKYKYVFTVAQDGSGEFTRIQDAINAMRVYPLAPITLYIKNGVYNEKIELPATNTDVRMVGESVEGTIIRYNDYSGKGPLTTFTSYTAKISGNRFRAENITFENSAGRVGQAVALHVDADQALFINCRFIGNQDTIFNGGEFARQYFFKCYVEGTTDFIFGPATVVFDQCRIRAKTNSYITAASTTPGSAFGFVFLDCKVEADSSVTSLYLGRPWRAHAKTAFIRCDLPGVIHPKGWSNWDNPENERTVAYAEHACTGVGANTSQRVKWMKQLNKKDASLHNVANIFTQKPAPSSDWYSNLSANTFAWPAAK